MDASGADNEGTQDSLAGAWQAADLAAAAIGRLDAALAQVDVARRMGLPERTCPQIGRYLLQSRIGEGAMGVVYRARDPKLNRDVAIKIIRRPLDVELDELQSREAQALAKVSHANVLQVYDVGEWEGRLFLATEWIRGETLRAWQQNEKPPLERVIAAHLEAGRGLAAVHRAGLVHRDYKPDNVFVDEHGIAKVGDFGLARHVQDAQRATTIGFSQEIVAVETGSADMVMADKSGNVDVRPFEEATSTTIAGTPRYMAPEVLAGRSHTIFSDQFSFALSLLEAIWATQNNASVRGQRRDAAILNERILARAAPPELSKARRKALLRALAIEPSERWPSVESFVAAMQAPPKRRLWTGMLLTIVSLGGVAYAAKSTADDEKQARALEQACARVRFASEDLLQRVERAPQSRVSQATQTTTQRLAWEWNVSRLQTLATHTLAHVDELCSATRPEQRALVRESLECIDVGLPAFSDILADAMVETKTDTLQHQAAAIDVVVEVLSACKLTTDDASPDLVVGDIGQSLIRARVALESGNWVEARAYASDLVGRTVEHSPVHLDAELIVARAKELEGQRETARKEYREILSSALELRVDDTQIAVLQALVNSYGLKDTNYESAQIYAHQLRALAARTGVPIAVRADTAWLLGRLAYEQGQYEAADYEFRRALRYIRELDQQTGVESARLARTNILTAELRMHLHEFTDASELLDDAETALDRLGATLRPETVAILNRRSHNYRLQGMKAQALDAAQRAVHLSEQILSESHPERAYARWVLSVMQIRNFALDDAKASALESLRILEISSLPYALERSRALTVLGMIARRTSDSEGSIAYHRQARKVLHDALPKLHPAKVIPALNLAEGVLEQDSIPGSLESARFYLHEALQNVTGLQAPNLRARLPILEQLYRIALAQRDRDEELALRGAISQLAFELLRRAQEEDAASPESVASLLTVAARSSIRVQDWRGIDYVIAEYPDAVRAAGIDGSANHHAMAMLNMNLLAQYQRYEAMLVYVAKLRHEFASFFQTQPSSNESLIEPELFALRKLGRKRESLSRIEAYERESQSEFGLNRPFSDTQWPLKIHARKQILQALDQGWRYFDGALPLLFPYEIGALPNYIPFGELREMSW